MVKNVLVVDDEESIRFTLKVILSEEGYRVETAGDFFEAVAKLEEVDFDLVFADILLGTGNGIDVLRTIKNKPGHCPVIMITGSPDVETASEAVRLGAFDYIPKPVRQETLLRVAKMALRQKELYEQNERYRLNLEAIFSSVKDAIIMVDKDLQVVEFNQAAKGLCGISEQDIGRRPERFLARCGSPCLEALEKTIRLGQPVEIPRTLCKTDENPQKVLNLTATPIRADQDHATGAVLVVRDETLLDELERDLDKRKQFHNIIGQSKKMQEVYSLIECLADVTTTALVIGETGTGKELVGEAIHFKGVRKDGPLVKVNCAALSEHLLESELFGHVKGAFTGAVKDKIGRFEKASGGTIFLDEIGDISPGLQVRLLRVLQEKKIERVGDVVPIPVDVRIVAATNQNLAEKIRRGEFREDLFYRLKVVTVPLPPLRERKEDIPLLVGFFTADFNAKFGKNIRTVSDEVMRTFLNHDWPGNIRELQHVLEHAFVLCRHSAISAEHLPPEFKAAPKLSPAATASTRDEEERLIRDALGQTDGNKAKAARLLNTSRRTLYRKIKAYGLDR